MMQKKTLKWLKSWQMGTQLRVLSKSYPMNTNMTGFRCFLKDICVHVLWANVASALNRLKPTFLRCILSREGGIVVWGGWRGWSNNSLLQRALRAASIMIDTSIISYTLLESVVTPAIHPRHPYSTRRRRVGYGWLRVDSRPDHTF